MIRMQAAKMYNRKIVHYVADDAKKRVNAAFLIGAYSVCLLLFLLLLLRQIRFVHVSSSWLVIRLQVSASLSFSDTVFMSFFVPSVLWRCWLGGRKGIWPVKNRVVGYWHGVCLERGADLHMAQLMPLSLAPVKSRLVLPFWYRLTQVVLEKRPLNGSCLLSLWVFCTDKIKFVFVNWCQFA